MITISSVNALVPLQHQAITTAPIRYLNRAYPLDILNKFQWNLTQNTKIIFQKCVW